MKKLVVSLEDGRIIAEHEPEQRITVDKYEGFGPIVIGEISENVYRRRPEPGVGFEWTDQSEMFSHVKELAVQTAPDDETKAQVEKAKKLSAVRAIFE